MRRYTSPRLDRALRELQQELDRDFPVGPIPQPVEQNRLPCSDSVTNKANESDDGSSREPPE